MSDLVELLNDLNQGNRIEYSDYSQLMFCVEQLEKEKAKLSKMLEMAINDTIKKGNQCFYCKDNYTKNICDNCTKENRINVMKLYRAELEKRVENEK